MVEVLHVGSLLPAAVGACCALGDRQQRSAVSWAPALVMLAAMLDVIAGLRLVHPLVWALALVGLSVWPAIRHRRGPMASGAGMAVHRSLGLLITAGLIVAMNHSGETASHHSAGMWQAAGMAAVVGYAGLSLWLAWSIRNRQRSRVSLPSLESASMGMSVVLMAGAALL